MALRILGDHPFTQNGQEKLKSYIGTVFPRANTLVTLPGIHATQRLAYVQALNQERQAQGLPPLTEEEEMVVWQQSVDLIMEPEYILIRPDPDNMPLAFEADECLQQLVSKRSIRFLHVMNEKVRQAIKERGENWRITPLPQTPDEMKKMIENSRLHVGGRAIYYYNKVNGTHFLTHHEFAQLGHLPYDALVQQLSEIQNLSTKHNRHGYPELGFFAADASFGPQNFAAYDILHADPQQLLTWYMDRETQFYDAVRPEMRQDNLDSPEWRMAMVAALMDEREQAFTEEIQLGLSTEFYMQIEWLPGACIEDGEIMFDPIFDEFDRNPAAPELAALCDERARGFIFNFVREFGDLEYVNIGRVIGSLSLRPKDGGRRSVYVAEIKQRDIDKPVVRILRIQKWGIREHLENNKDLLAAIMQAEDYTEYILDRRLGCRQLGMNLPKRIATRKLTDKYHGSRPEYEGRMIWSTYFERDYVRGVATDKIAKSRYQSAEYSHRLAVLLGRAAAVNIIVGRMNLEHRVLFDDGDEVVVENAIGMPEEIVVADHTGTFTDYKSSLTDHAAAYAQPVNRRVPWLFDPSDFAEAYVTAFVERLVRTQEEYWRRRRAFDRLFKHRQRDELGSFAFRWEKVLERLNNTDAIALGEVVRKHLRLS
jgi:hypothetical protein